MYKLPIEILYHIISYSYKIQPIDLRNDIISFYKTNNNIINIFMKRYYNLSFISNSEYIKHLLLFHIISYLTRLKNTYTSNSPCILFDVYKRIYMLKNKNIENTHVYLQNHFNFNCKMYWGLLTPEERNEFIQLQISQDSNRMP
jgi:hypothetical protein